MIAGGGMPGNVYIEQTHMKQLLITGALALAATNIYGQATTVGNNISPGISG